LSVELEPEVALTRQRHADRYNANPVAMTTVEVRALDGTAHRMTLFAAVDSVQSRFVVIHNQSHGRQRVGKHGWGHLLGRRDARVVGFG